MCSRISGLNRSFSVLSFLSLNDPAAKRIAKYMWIGFGGAIVVFFGILGIIKWVGKIEAGKKLEQRAETTKRDLEKQGIAQGIAQERAKQAEKERQEEKKNWRQLQKGMTKEQVKALLGDPVKVNAITDSFTYWYYGGMFSQKHVCFRKGYGTTTTELLDSWEE